MKKIKKGVKRKIKLADGYAICEIIKINPKTVVVKLKWTGDIIKVQKHKIEIP